MIDLDSLERKLNKALSEETEESLNKWLRKKRIKKGGNMRIKKFLEDAYRCIKRKGEF